MVEHKPQLVRGLGLAAASSIVVGTVIGTGIFLVTSSMLAAVKSPWVLILVWIAGALLSLFGALTYAELGAMLPEAGGEFVFLRRSYGKLPAYLYGWTLFSVAKPGSIAAQATGFALFVTVLFPSLDVTWQQFVFHPGGGREFILRIGGIQAIAVTMVLLLSAANARGVKIGGGIQTVFTVCKVGGILALVALGFGLGKGDWGHFEERAIGNIGSSAWALFGVALIQALWAYDGWNNLPMVAGEVKQPQKNVPRALIVGMMLVGGLYIVTNVAYVYVLAPDQIAASTRVASSVASELLGQSGANFIALVAAISTFASLNGSILTGSRVPYAAARDGLLFRPLARIHPRWLTPHISIAVQASFAIALVFSGTFSEIITYVIFSEWVFYALVTSGVFLLRRREPDLPRPYRTWGYPWVPAGFVICSLLLLVNILIEQPMQSGFGLLIIVSGLLFYPMFRKRNATQEA
ncbi:MAG TPA: amino acid permease [Acidobacteriota bacterium]|nr:amino acid permease [Acidobacteriota bacterium]